jgi:hypothetical protein
MGADVASLRFATRTPAVGGRRPAGAIAAPLQNGSFEVNGRALKKRPPGHRAAFAFWNDPRAADRYLAAATM